MSNMYSFFQTYPVVDLPYDLSMLSQEPVSARRRRATRDMVTDTLRGKTALLRVAHDYYNSYEQALVKTLSHYRDYLVSEAALHSLRSLMFSDAQHTRPNQIYERASEMPWDALWSLPRDKDPQPRYNGTRGSLAHYFSQANITGSPLESLDALTTTIWSRNGIDPTADVSDRLESLYLKMRLNDSVLSNAEQTLSNFFASANGPMTEDDYALFIQARRKLITPEDLRDLPERLLYGTYNKDALNLYAALLSDEDRRRLERIVGYVDSLAKPTGFHALLQALAVEGYVNSAMAIDALPDELAFTPLQYILESKDSELSDLKQEIAENLYLASSAFGLQRNSDLLADAADSSARAYNASLHWLLSSNQTELPVQGPVDIRPFVATYLPDLSSFILYPSTDSAVDTGDSLFSFLQGRPPKNSLVFLNADSSVGYTIPLQVMNSDGSAATDQTVATITPPDDSSAATSGLTAQVAHPGTEEALTIEQYEALPESSNVVVTYQGDPAGNLTPQINSGVQQQHAAYSAVNTLYIAPSPRGVLGQEELIRGMVSHLFRDHTAEEVSNRAKTDGKREEHTSRVGGFLQQMKATHLDSEIATLKTWSDKVDNLFS